MRGGGVSEDEEPSLLERIMPPLPASRREVFLSVEAFSGLEQPFTAKGDQVSARVFWNGEEVCEEGGTTAGAAKPTGKRKLQYVFTLTQGYERRYSREYFKNKKRQASDSAGASSANNCNRFHSTCHHRHWLPLYDDVLDTQQIGSRCSFVVAGIIPDTHL